MTKEEFGDEGAPWSMQAITLERGLEVYLDDLLEIERSREGSEVSVREVIARLQWILEYRAWREEGRP